MSGINPITSAGPSLSAGSISSPALPKSGGTGFMNLIEDMLGKVNVQQSGADQAVLELAMGETDNLHGVMLAAAKADLSFRAFLEIRNRLTEALQEIMRMQV